MPSMPAPPPQMNPKNWNLPRGGAIIQNKDFFLNNKLARLLTFSQDDKTTNSVQAQTAANKPTAKINPLSAPQSNSRPNYGKSAPAPLPPPRAKRDVTIKADRLATVAPRGARPVAPPTVPPLEIGAPTSVTINGVSVTSTQETQETVAVPPPLPKCPPPEEDFDDVNLESVA